MAVKINGLSLDLISHPSETIYELMMSRKYTPLFMCEKLNVSYKEFESFLKGKCLLAPNKYRVLSELFNIKERFFEQIFSSYQFNLVNALNKEDISNFEFNLANSLDLTKFKKYIPRYNEVRSSSLTQKIKWMRNYFQVNYLDVFKNFLNTKASFRSKEDESGLVLEKIFLISHLVKNLDETVSAKSIIAADLFKELKEATFEKTLDDTTEVVKNILLKYGINFIYYPYESKLKVQGFVARHNDSIYLGVSNKGKYHDIFWFTLCHELGHLLLGVLNFDYAIFDDEEKMADQFAEKVLINEHEYDFFVDRQNFTSKAVLEFSDKINVAPGIIVGRLQKDKLIGKETLNYLRKKD